MSAGRTIRPILGQPLDGPLDGPAWDRDGLLACRPEANEIVRVDPATGTTTRVRHSTAGACGLAFAPDGRLYAAQARARRVVWLDTVGGGAFYLTAMLDGQRHNDPQDLAVDDAGRVWLTDDWTAASTEGPVGWPPLPHRSVLRLTRIAETDDRIGEWRLERMSDDTRAPHGIAIDARAGTVYVTDRGEESAPATLRAYPLAATAAGGGRVVHTFVAAERPAGLCLDGDGRLVVAVAGGEAGGRGMIAWIDGEGRVRDRAAIEGSPTNVALGGADGRTLYVTTVEGQVFSVEPAGSSA